MDGFPGLIRMIDELHLRIKNELPLLYAHFEYLDIVKKIIFNSLT